MKRVIFTAIIILLSCVAFGQTYDIKFDVIEKAQPFLGKDWEFNYTPWKTMTVSFDGKQLKVNYKENGKIYLICNIDEIKHIEEYDKYDKSKLKYKSYVLRSNEEGYYLYYVIKYEYGLWSQLKSLHIPYRAKDGRIQAYTIFQSDFISL